MGRIPAFASHASSQHHEVDELVHRLRLAISRQSDFHLDVWVAPRCIPVGEPFDDCIRSAICKSHVCLVFLSKEYRNSSYAWPIERRLILKDKTKIVIPILLSPIAISRRAIGDFAPLQVFRLSDRSWEECSEAEDQAQFVFLLAESICHRLLLRGTNA